MKEYKTEKTNPEQPSVKFESLHLYRSFDGEIKGNLSIKSDDDSQVCVTLPEEPLEAIVDLVAEKLAEAASLQADRLRAAILNR